MGSTAVRDVRKTKKEGNMREIRIIFCVLLSTLITLCSVLVGCRYHEPDFLRILLTVCIFFCVIVIAYVILECILGKAERKDKIKKIDFLEKVRKELKIPQDYLQEIEITAKPWLPCQSSTLTKKKNFNYELYKDVINTLAEI